VVSCSAAITTPTAAQRHRGSTLGLWPAIRVAGRWRTAKAGTGNGVQRVQDIDAAGECRIAHLASAFSCDKSSVIARAAAAFFRPFETRLSLAKHEDLGESSEEQALAGRLALQGGPQALARAQAREKAENRRFVLFETGYGPSGLPHIGCGGCAHQLGAAAYLDHLGISTHQSPFPTTWMVAQSA
jgi:hypothetical protein